MNRLYNLCEGNKEPGWSRYTRLEVSGSKDHNGETEALVFAHEAEFFTVYGRLPNFEVEPITDCADATSLLAVAAELGYRSELEVFLHPMLFDTPLVDELKQRVPAMASTDDGVLIIAFDATSFFETAADELIGELLEDDFAGGYGADAVVQELADADNDVGRMFWYLEKINEHSRKTVGYKVSVDAASARSWLELYKPHLLAQEAS